MPLKVGCGRMFDAARDGRTGLLHRYAQSPWTSCALVGVLVIAAGMAAVAEKPQARDPAAWGSDHVGERLPDYLTGDECLFCHRKIGPAWMDNRHQLTIRPASPEHPAVKALSKLPKGNDLAAESRYLLGSSRITRFLKKSRDYGKLDLLSTSFVADDRQGALHGADAPRWDARTFADRCTGCHATAVDTTTRAFSAISLDCFTCHGDVELEHTKDVSKVHLSSESREPRVVISICGQCHLRGGKSQSTGLPYPNTFVAGDNLFRDFQVDFRNATVSALPPVDRHVYENARDVAVYGQSTTCLTCHDVHGQSTTKHRGLADAAICASCHEPGTDNTRLREIMLPSGRLKDHSRVCDY